MDIFFGRARLWHRAPRQRRRWLRGPVAVTAGLCATALAAAVPAHAYNLTSTTDANGNTVCSSIKFSSPQVQVVLHLTESKADPLEQWQILNAMTKVDDQLANVGASGVKIASITASYAPFVYQSWFGDTTPTLHVGFVTSLAKNEIGETTRNPSAATCTYDEAQIALLDLDTHAWNLGTPADVGQNYYDVSDTDSQVTPGAPQGATWFRQVYQHELLHGFGLAHTTKSYAMMNYGVKPWANRAQDDAIRPLPDDVRALRALYPASGSRQEVAVLDTWYSSDISDEKAAIQKKLCWPSLGAFVGAEFDDACGVSGSKGGTNLVCSGDSVKARFAVANYSTEDVELDLQLWFSPDAVFDSADIQSTTYPTLSLGSGHSKLETQAWTVPTITAPKYSVYFTIARAVGWFDLDKNGSADPGTPIITDWIPLRNGVMTC